MTNQKLLLLFLPSEKAVVAIDGVARRTSSKRSDPRIMITFTIDLWFGYSINPNRSGVWYAIHTGVSEACDIADSLRDESPPRIVVRDFGWGRDDTSVVVAEFAATEREEVDAVIKSISNGLGDSTQLRRAILRVPGAPSQDLR